MGNFKELLTVLLIFVCIESIFFTFDLHSILMYFFDCHIPAYKEEFVPYYRVIGIIAGLTALYITFQV